MCGRALLRMLHDLTLNPEQTMQTTQTTPTPTPTEALRACLSAMLNGVGERLPIQQGTLREEQDWQDAIRGARRALGLSDPIAELTPACDRY